MGYRVTDWQGHPNFECDECPRANLDERIIRRHIAEAHPGSPIRRADVAATLEEEAPPAPPADHEEEGTA